MMEFLFGNDLSSASPAAVADTTIATAAAQAPQDWSSSSNINLNDFNPLGLPSKMLLTQNDTFNNNNNNNNNNNITNYLNHQTIIPTNSILIYDDMTMNLASRSSIDYWSILHLMITILLCLISMFVVLGNSLVVGAIWHENQLHSVTNYLIASLAVADCLVGLVVMPFSIISEIIFGYWTFGANWCDLWHSFDVLASTASIMNLCAISFDRYLAITDPISYPSRLTPKRVALWIVSLWTCSALISFPAIIWWRSVGQPLVKINNTNSLHPSTQALHFPFPRTVATTTKTETETETIPLYPHDSLARMAAAAAATSLDNSLNNKQQQTSVDLRESWSSISLPTNRTSSLKLDIATSSMSKTHEQLQRQELIDTTLASASVPALASNYQRQHQEQDLYKCVFTDDPYYLLFSSVISFYVPLFVMLYAYYRIYKAAVKQMRFLKYGSKQVTIGERMANGTSKFYSSKLTSSWTTKLPNVVVGGGGCRSSGSQAKSSTSNDLALNGLVLRVHRGGGGTNSSMKSKQNSCTNSATAITTATTLEPLNDNIKKKERSFLHVSKAPSSKRKQQQKLQHKQAVQRSLSIQSRSSCGFSVPLRPPATSGCSGKQPNLDPEQTTLTEQREQQDETDETEMAASTTTSTANVSPEKLPASVAIAHYEDQTGKVFHKLSSKLISNVDNLPSISIDANSNTSGSGETLTNLASTEHHPILAANLSSSSTDQIVRINGLSNGDDDEHHHDESCEDEESDEEEEFEDEEVEEKLVEKQEDEDQEEVQFDSNSPPEAANDLGAAAYKCRLKTRASHRRRASSKRNIEKKSEMNRQQSLVSPFKKSSSLHTSSNSCAVTTASANAAASDMKPASPQSSIRSTSLRPQPSVSGCGKVANNNNNTHQQHRKVGRKLSRLAKERKAAKTLGIVVGVFILCWLPYFIVNITVALCGSHCITNLEIFVAIVTWLGWLNSAMNPVIYACWSREFRRAFRRVLCSWVIFFCPYGDVGERLIRKLKLKESSNYSTVTNATGSSQQDNVHYSFSAGGQNTSSIGNHNQSMRQHSNMSSNLRGSNCNSDTNQKNRINIGITTNTSQQQLQRSAKCNREVSTKQNRQQTTNGASECIVTIVERSPTDEV